MIRGRVLLPSVAVPRAAACKTAIKLYMLPPIYFIRHSVAKKIVHPKRNRKYVPLYVIIGQALANKLQVM